MIYELRTYFAAPGQTERLHRRFREHTIGLFARHGMHVVGFWVPEGAPDTLIYMMRFDSPEAMQSAWTAFAADPDWKQAKADSEVEGRLVRDFTSEILSATAYSPAV